MKTPQFKIIILVLVFIGIILGIYLIQNLKHKQKPLYWIDPMEPTVLYNHPGKSRMDMELVPVYAQEDKLGAIKVSPEAINNVGVRIAPVIQGDLSRRLETVGYIEPNENNISHIHVYAEGWIKKLNVKTMGETVKKGELLFQLYSPALVNAQEEYLIALESKDADLIDASHQRLLALGISEQQIQQLKETHKASQLIDVYSPQNGIVSSLDVREGMNVMPETNIMSLVDLSNIWMIVEVFEKQAAWVKVNQIAEGKTETYPGQVWKGKVEYVYPQVDPATRTLKVRLRFDNPDNNLKPNMVMNVALLADPKQNVLSIPKEAVIHDKQQDRVIVALGNGYFRVQPVVVGMESGSSVEILSGLKAGESIVISGQFLIDSESNLQASLKRVDSNT
ncbi:MAG TPA: efflux RND transporter periplasmic adaptor subunit [Gammaproteobacteria bacterium]|nr:efflux RND transporter periplasmic adaptor subunit [Gammaproteobacteria bacterium]